MGELGGTDGGNMVGRDVIKKMEKGVCGIKQRIDSQLTAYDKNQ